MSAATFRNEERLGLIVAIAAHAALFAWLALWRPEAEVVEPPESVSVTLSEEVGLVATTPDPSADPAPATAPMQGGVPPPSEPLPSPEISPQPQPVARVVPTPLRSVPKPVTRPTPKRDTMADLLDRRLPPQKPPAKPPGKPPAKPPTGRTGAPDFADAFGKGVPGATGTGRPNAAPGPAEISSFRAVIRGQVLPPWNSCSVTGLDVNKLKAAVTFTMDQQGRVTSVAEPVMSGISDANRAQAKRFAECAVKAVRLGGPYKLPVEFYPYWKTYKFNFSKGS
jgi:hypothetical protein